MDQQGKNWPNWGDHPFVVSIGTVAAIITIIVFIVGKDELSKFWSDSSQLNQALTSKEPEERAGRISMAPAPSAPSDGASKSGEGLATTDSPLIAWIDPRMSKIETWGGQVEFVFFTDRTKRWVCPWGNTVDNPAAEAKWALMPTGIYTISPFGVDSVYVKWHPINEVK